VLSAPQVRRGGARLVDLGLLGVALAWGASYLAAKIATGLSPVPVVLLGRYALSAAACVLIAGLASRTTGRPLVTRAELKAGVLLGTTQAAVLALETWGVAGTSAANAGVLISFTIILTPVIEAGLGGSLPRRFFLAAGVSVAGIIVLTSTGGLTGLRIGDLLVLAAALVRAGNVVLIGRLSARSREQLRPLNLTMVQVVVGTAWEGCRTSSATRSSGPSSPSWPWDAVFSHSWSRPGVSSRPPRPAPACYSAPSRCGPSWSLSLSAASTSRRSRSPAASSSSPAAGGASR
jgi:drug/metabolite transporter (DMT)-like permease